MNLIKDILNNMKGLSLRKKFLWIIGLLMKSHSCTGKIGFSEKSARKAKISMEKKYSEKKFDFYRCFWCTKFRKE